MSLEQRVFGVGRPAVPRRVQMEAPWSWLAAGWRDMWDAPGVSLVYGGVFTVVSFVLTGGLYLMEALYLLPALAAGFLLLGPMLAVGLYETSRRLEEGEAAGLKTAFFVGTASPTQIAFLGVILAGLLLTWMWAALLMFGLFLGITDVPSMDELMGLLLFTPEGLTLLVSGTAVGAVIAALVFSISVVSAPMLLERDVDAVSAMLLSLRVVRLNWRVMLLWAWLIALLTACGLVTLYLGLIITFPLVGHASWHAYRDLVADSA